MDYINFIFKKKIIIIELLIIVLIPLLIGTAWGSPFMGQLNMIDEGQFAAWANHMLHGKLLYKDIYVTYGPLYIYPLYILFKIFGPSAFLARIYLTTGGIIGLSGCLVILRSFKVNFQLRIIALFIIMLIPSMMLRQGLPLLTMGVFFYYIAHNARKMIFLVGILTSICSLISLEFGIILFLLFVAYFIYSFIFSKYINNPLIHFLLFISGLILPLAVFALFAGYEGWLYAYIAVSKDVLISFSGSNIPNGMNIPNVFLYFGHIKNISDLLKAILNRDVLMYWMIGFYVIFIYYLIASIKRQSAHSKIKLLFFWAFGCISSLLIISRPGIGHFFYICPPCIILCVYLISRLYKKIKENDYLFVLPMFILVIFLLRIVSINRPFIYSIIGLQQVFMDQCKTTKRVGCIKVPYLQGKYIKNMQQFIARNTNSNDTIFYFDDEPMMYMLVNRVNATSFDLPFTANYIEKRYQLLNQLIERKPKYVFYNKSTWFVDGISDPQRLPEAWDYIIHNYKRIAYADPDVLVYLYTGK